MKQKFFQDVIERAKLDTLTPPQSDLCRKVLYELLILPALKENLPPKWKSSLVDQQPSDVLHGLHNLVLGPGRPGFNISCEQEADDDIDLEPNEEYFDSSIIHDEDDETSPTDNVGRIRTFLKAIGFRNAIDDDRKRIFPSVTELKRAGIHVKKLKTGGVRSIWFESWYFWANLYLPVFPVDEHTVIISESEDTTADAKLLKKQGVVVIGGNSDYVEKLPGILDRLSSDHDIRLTCELHTVRRQISEYSSPWVHYKGLVKLVALLTVIQTLFALLAYFKPPKP
ncbi:hypothetical protein Salat_1736600 [Sesamum alatum]|uniref:Uncharacterized protein n=1 Tax=Sesamum alatum TaxID=300844 RepID=A0AAE1Y856_9LAMI|nr:hypothetical protein Salat_1736600 [Sesamum alatum]